MIKNRGLQEWGQGEIGFFNNNKKIRSKSPTEVIQPKFEEAYANGICSKL